MKCPMNVFSARWLVLYAFVCTSNYSYSDAAIIGRAATIFGFGATRADESKEQQDPRFGSGGSGPPFSNQHPPPPPKGFTNIQPPPPPPKFFGVNPDALDTSDDSLGNQTQIAHEADNFPGQQQQQNAMLPPRSPADNVPLQHPGHVSIQPGRMPFNQQARGPGGPLQQPPNYVIQGMQHDLEVAFQREHGLRAHLSNITTQLANMQQREDLHVRQLDVLTERVIETEAIVAKERNELLQYKNNCTEMGKQIALLEGSVEEWRQKCSEHVAQVARLRNESEALGTKLEKMTIKAEDLATLVERHRIAEQDDEVTTALQQRRKSERKRGFFAWLFGWGADVSPVDDSLEALREEARLTLISALQRERDNVEELESVVTVLQRNNTALAEQVKSRDDIMEELNDRIGVFEEDRIVLKAALRQLKKDMSEEAPKTQRIAHELELARIEIDRLQNEIESLVASHEEEIAHLRSTIQEKQDAMQVAESNLTMIGTYVRKLEERLGDFAVARREIEAREQKCLEIESDADEGRRSRQVLEDEVASLQKEHQEFRDLIEELIQARTRLKLETDQLRNERDTMKRTQSQLTFNVKELKEMISSLHDENSLLSSQYFSLEQEYNETKGNLAAIQGQSVANEDFEIMVRKLKSLEDSKENLEAQLVNLQQEKESSLQKVHSAYSALQSTEEKLSQLQSALSNLNDTSARERESLQHEIQRTANLLHQAEEKAALLEKQLDNAKQNEEALLEKVELARMSSASNATSHVDEALKPNLPPPALKISEAQEKGSDAITRSKNSTNPSTSDKNAKKGEKPQVKQGGPPLKRQVPLRNLRKTFSKLTGVHGLITKPSRSHAGKSSRNEPIRSQTQSANVAAHRHSYNQSLQGLHNATDTNSTRGQRPLSLPTTLSNFSIGATNTTRAKPPSVKDRKIPFRSFRKFSSKITGVHGLFSRPSSPRQSSGRALNSGNKQISSDKRIPSSASQTSMPVSLRELPKHTREENHKSQSTQTGESQTSTPVSFRPELPKHSVEDIRKPQSATQTSYSQASTPVSSRPELPKPSVEDGRKPQSQTSDSRASMPVSLRPEPSKYPVEDGRKSQSTTSDPKK